MSKKMKTAQAEPREFYIQKTLVTVGAKVEAMYKVYLQMPDNAASNEYNHGDIYFHVIEISAVEALESQNSILKQQIAELNEDIRQDYIDSATRERELVKKLDDMSQVGIRNLELESQLKLAMIKPEQVDKAICDWSMENMHSLTEHEQASLVSMIFNQLFSDGNVHTMPNDNEHLETEKCWCNPILNYEDKETHIKHYIHTDTRKEALN